MARLDKQSLREQFDKLKSDFSALSRKGKRGPDSIALVNGLILLMELMLAIFLEKHTKKTSQNSSKPSSQTPKDETALDKPGAN